MTELLSIKDISQELGIPQSTLRYYRDLFMDYLPATGEGKKKRFYPEAVEVFQAIAKGMHQNKNADDIATDLNKRFTRFIDVEDTAEESQESSATYSQDNETCQSQALSPLTQSDGSAIMAVIAAQNQALQQIAATISVVNEQQEELHQLKQEVSKLEERLETELTDHFQLVDNRLRQVMEERDSSKPKSFWQRLFG